jgi:hypothetical protein
MNDGAYDCITYLFPLDIDLFNFPWNKSIENLYPSKQVVLPREVVLK